MPHTKVSTKTCLKNVYSVIPEEMHSWIWKSRTCLKSDYLELLEKFTHYEFRNHMQFTTYMIVLPIISKSFSLIKVNSSFYLIIFSCSYCYSTSETAPKKCMFSYTLKVFKYWDIVIMFLINILFSVCYGLHVCVLPKFKCLNPNPQWGWY